MVGLAWAALLRVRTSSMGPKALRITDMVGLPLVSWLGLLISCGFRFVRVNAIRLTTGQDLTTRRRENTRQRFCFKGRLRAGTLWPISTWRQQPLPERTASFTGVPLVHHEPT